MSYLFTIIGDIIGNFIIGNFFYIKSVFVTIIIK